MPTAGWEYGRKNGGTDRLMKKQSTILMFSQSDLVSCIVIQIYLLRLGIRVNSKPFGQLET